MRNSNSIERHLQLASIPFLLFFVVPGFLVSRNPSDYQHLDVGVAFVCMVVAVSAVFLILLLADHVARRVGMLTAWSILIDAGFVFILIAGLFSPVTQGGGMLIDPISDPVDRTGLATALAVAGIGTLLLQSRVRRIILAGIATVLLVNAAVSALAFHELYAAWKPKTISNDDAVSELLRVSDEMNIFTISFDGLSRDVYVNTLRKHGGQFPSLKDFVVFDDVSTSSPATVASLSGELYGNQNFKLKAETDFEMRDIAPDRLMTNYLNDNGYRVSTYFDYGRGFRHPERRFAIGDLSAEGLHQKTFAVINTYRYVTLRIGTNYTVRALRKVGMIIDFDTLVRLVLDQFELPNEMFALAGWNFENRLWNAQLKYSSVSDYNQYVSGLEVGSDRKVAHFLHFYQTHYPINIDEDCNLYDVGTDWFSNHQNDVGMQKESFCMLTQMSLFVEKLKSLGIYDQSIIILKSDHGRPARYYDPARLVSFRIRGHKDWGYGRYTPLLMVKGARQTQEAIGFNDQPVMTDDLARTLCLHSGVGGDCSVYPGFDLLAPDLEVPPESEAFYFVVESEKSNFSFGSHEPLVLLRRPDFLNNLHAALTAEALSVVEECRASYEADNPSGFNNGFSDYNRWASWFTESGFHVQLASVGCDGRLQVAITSDSDPRFEVEARVYVSANAHVVESDEPAWAMTVPVREGVIEIDVPRSIVSQSHMIRIVVDASEEQNADSFGFHSAKFGS